MIVGEGFLIFFVIGFGVFGVFNKFVLVIFLLLNEICEKYSCLFFFCLLLLFIKVFLYVGKVGGCLLFVFLLLFVIC